MVPKIDTVRAAEMNRPGRHEHKHELEPESPVGVMPGSISENKTEAIDRVPALPQPPKLRPDAVRSTTDPSPSALLQSYFASTPSPSRSSSTHSSRSSSYTRSHLRSRSTNSTTGAPVIVRAHSMPTVHTVRGLEASSIPPSPRSISPGSSLRSPARVRSPFRTPTDDTSYNAPPRSPSWYEGPGSTAIESIQEDSELDITPRAQLPISAPSPMHTASFQRSSSLRRRPASPLHSAMTMQSQPQIPSKSYIDQDASYSAAHSYASSSGSSSPSLGPQRERFVNESYPGLHHYASNSSFSSIPSTPTSARSRSPSISSLDTIEDAPDLESEAIEMERNERLKLAAEREEREEHGEPVGRRAGSLDGSRTQQGFGFGRNGGSAARGGERKRWSICGGERRGDLDLETIWED